MNNEKNFTVTLVKGPQTSIMPIKALSTEHAVAIACQMGLGTVVSVTEKI
jgi:hypothetical protein